MLVRSWKHQLLLLCPAKLWKRIVGSGGSNKLKTRLACILEAVILQDCVWGNHYRLIMKTILQEKVENSLQHYNLVHKFVLVPQAVKIPAAKAVVDKEWENWRKFRRGTWQKSKVRNKWSIEARTKGAEGSFCPYWWTSVIWRMPNWRQSTKNIKVRVVLRGDIVKDDSGSYAVFTKQGSSASQITAAKIMDIISRLPGCDGHASRRSISLYPSKTNYWKFQNRSVQDIWIRLPRHKWPKSWSSMEDPSCSSWAESVRSSFGRTIMGKAIWEDPIEIRLGEGFQLGKRVVLICVCDDLKNWLERNKTLIRCGNYAIEVDLGRTNIFPWSCILGLHSKTMWN